MRQRAAERRAADHRRYSMGSTSSVGQSCSSDLDIWVCHQLAG
jgi:adenylate cyclase